MVTLREPGAERGEAPTWAGLYIVRLVAEFHGGTGAGPNPAAAGACASKSNCRKLRT
jgi:hypothetical protein